MEIEVGTDYPTRRQKAGPYIIVALRVKSYEPDRAYGQVIAWPIHADGRQGNQITYADFVFAQRVDLSKGTKHAP